MVSPRRHPRAHQVGVDQASTVSSGGVGPLVRRSSTLDIASRSSASHSSACWPTSRTAQASASGASGPRPRRPGCPARPLGLAQPRHHRRRQRREQLLDIPSRAPHATLRWYLCSAWRAISMRSSRVDSRKREIRPAIAAARSARPVSASANSPSSAGSSPTTLISSRSTTTSGAPANQPSGSRPASNLPRRRRPAASACCQPPRPGPRPPCPRPPGPCHPRCIRPYIGTPPLLVPWCFALTALHSSRQSCHNTAPGGVNASQGELLESVVTGRSQTNPRQTYAAGRPSTSGRSASSGTPSASGTPARRPPTGGHPVRMGAPSSACRLTVRADDGHLQRAGDSRLGDGQRPPGEPGVAGQRAGRGERSIGGLACGPTRSARRAAPSAAPPRAPTPRPARVVGGLPRPVQQRLGVVRGVVEAARPSASANCSSATVEQPRAPRPASAGRRSPGAGRAAPRPGRRSRPATPAAAPTAPSREERRSRPSTTWASTSRSGALRRGLDLARQFQQRAGLGQGRDRPARSRP